MHNATGSTHKDEDARGWLRSTPRYEYIVQNQNVTIHLPAPGSSFFSLHDDLADRGGACSDPKAKKDQ